MAPLPQFYAALLAGTRLEVGSAARAIEPLDTILSTVKEPGVGFFLPEIHRLRGECLLHLDGGSFDDAVREFETAIAFAKQQQEHVFRLRAAISLAQVYRGAGMPEKGTDRSAKRSMCSMAPTTVPELAPARNCFPRPRADRRESAQVFIDSKNSALFLVLRSLSSRKSMASMVPIGLRMRRSTYIFLS